MTGGQRTAFLVPHPPILVPEVARGRNAEIQTTARSMQALAAQLDEAQPDALVLMSPHAPMIGRKIAVITGHRYQGSLAQFGAGEARLDAACDGDLAAAIVDAAGEDALLIETGTAAPLDHGALVPLSFLDPGSRHPLVLLSIALNGMATFERVGAAIGRAAEHLGRRIVFVGSGDLSHRLTPDAPAGYVPEAAKFDREIVRILEKGDLDALADLDPELVERAGECGLRSIYTAAGYVGPHPSLHEVLSYEGPFGVGYLVARLGS